MWLDMILVSIIMPIIWYMMTSSSYSMNTERRNGPEYLIRGQTLAEYNEERAPFVVSVRSRSPMMFWGDNHFCGGVIISDEVVLTAAHCVVDKYKVLIKARRLLVVAGTYNRLKIEKSTRQLRVKDVKPHPKFLRYSTNDIAMLILKSAFPDDVMNIKRILLSDQPSPYNKRVNIYGWGRIFERGPYATRLRTTRVTLLPSDECRKLLPSIRESFMCSYEKNINDKNPCRGDSGGPVVYNKKLVGIITWSLGCGNPDSPSLYVDVHTNREWIKNNLGSWSLIFQFKLIGLTFLLLTF